MIIGCAFWYRYLLYCLRGSVLDYIRPSPDSVFSGLLIDMISTKMELMAENAFLRQQMRVLSRSGKRPLPTPRDRVLLPAREQGSSLATSPADCPARNAATLASRLVSLGVATQIQGNNM